MVAAVTASHGAASLSCAECDHATEVPSELLAYGTAPLACSRCGGLAWGPAGLEQKLARDPQSDLDQDEEQPAA